MAQPRRSVAAASSFTKSDVAGTAETLEKRGVRNGSLHRENILAALVAVAMGTIRIPPGGARTYSRDRQRYARECLDPLGIGPRERSGRWCKQGTDSQSVSHVELLRRLSVRDVCQKTGSAVAGVDQFQAEDLGQDHRVTAGGFHTCGLTPEGAAYCWESNSEGQLGDGTGTQQGTPTSVSFPVGATLASLAVGVYHTCGVTPAGAAYCWGENANGQLGDGTTNDRLSPVAVVSQ